MISRLLQRPSRSLLLLFLTAMLPAMAQDHQPQPAFERGFKPELAYDTKGFESVNLWSGNLILSIPLGSYPVAADVAYSFVLRYSGNPWFYLKDCPVPGIGDPPVEDCPIEWLPIAENAGLGWNLSFGSLAQAYSLEDVAVPALAWKYTSPDGSEHNFYQTLHEPKCSGQITANCDSVTAGIFYTRDGSFIRLRDQDTVKVVEFPTGERQRFVKHGSVFRLQYIYGASSMMASDGTPESNFVKFEYPVRPVGNINVVDWRVTDSHGRIHDVIFQAPTGSPETHIIDTIKLAASRRPEDPETTSPTAEYNLTYDSYTTTDGDAVTIDTPCTTPQQREVPVRFLKRLDLPSGETWEFAYASSDQCATAGTIERAKLPTGGNIRWSYQTYATSSSGINASTGLRYRCMRRDTEECSDTDTSGMQNQFTRYTTESGVTTVETYARKLSGWGRESQTKNYFVAGHDANAGLPYGNDTDGSTPARYLSWKIFDCNPVNDTCNTTPERSHFVRYEMDASGLCNNLHPCIRERNRRVVSERTVFDSDVVEDVTAKVDVDRSLFDGLGHYRKTVTTTDFHDQAATRETYVNFNPAVATYALTTAGAREAGYAMLSDAAPWILHTYTDTYTLEGNSASYTEACFDTNNGFLKRSRIKSDGTGAESENDLLRVFTPHASGYASREEWFGGDLQAVATTDPLCDVTLPTHDQYSFAVDHTYQYGVLKTSKNSGMTWFAVNNSKIDQNTGLVLESEDPSTLATSFVYDRRGRLTDVDPPGIDATTYVYTNATASSPARITSTTGSGDLSIERKWEFDVYGRLEYERRKQPDNTWSVVKTTYDSLGRTATISTEQSATTATFANNTTYGDYDIFGRVKTVTQPDGKTVSFEYIGERLRRRAWNVATAEGDTDVTVEEERDALGRLVKVTEDSTSESPVLAEYTYHEGGELNTVGVGSGTDLQPRTFSVDNRGLLTSEEHPESGTTSYQYDARGNVITRTTPVATLTHAYDQAGRLKSVSQGSVALQSFTYDRANSPVANPTDYSLGKQATATRKNTSAELGTFSVLEEFTYAGRGGRLSKKTTKVTREDTNATSTFSDEYTYDAVGALQTVWYPACAAGDCLSLAAPTRSVTNTYDHGALTDVSPYTWSTATVPGITYHPNGLVNTVRHNNVTNTAGPVQVHTIADGMPRVNSISVTGFCDATNLSVSRPQPQPRSVVINSPAGLTVSASGATSYQWFRVVDGTPVLLAGQTTTSLNIPVTEESIYFVRVGNGSCTVDSERSTVNILACTPPNAPITAPATLVASAIGSASVPQTAQATYTWSIGNGTLLTGEGTHEITFRVGCSGTTSLAVTVSKDGCSTPETDTVAINPPTATMSITGQSVITQGQSATLRADLTGVGPWTVTWSHAPGDPQTVQPPATHATRSVSPNVTTSYSLTAVDSAQCTLSVVGAPVTVTVKPPPPTSVLATAVSTSQVNVSWSFSGIADRFDIYRSGVLVGSTTPPIQSFSDLGVPASSAFVYTVRAVRSNTSSNPSNGDLATTLVFTDVLIAGQTIIKAVHVTQLQTAINAVRAAAGLAPQSFPSITPGVTVVGAIYFESLRTALAPARAALGLSGTTYSRAPLVPGMIILASDLNETREAVR